MSAIGQLFAYVVGAIDTVSIFGTFLGDTQFKQMTVIAALSLMVAVAITSYSVKERVLISARWVELEPILIAINSYSVITGMTEVLVLFRSSLNFSKLLSNCRLASKQSAGPNFGLGSVWKIPHLRGNQQC